MMTAPPTPQTLIDRYTVRLWRLWLDRQQSRLRAAFPDTGGDSLLVHNWYRCGTDLAKSELASRLLEVESWERIQRRYRRELQRAEHHHQHGGHFRPGWCVHCQKREK